MRIHVRSEEPNAILMHDTYKEETYFANFIFRDFWKIADFG